MAIAGALRIARDLDRDSTAPALPFEGLFNIAHEFSLLIECKANRDREAIAMTCLEVTPDSCVGSTTGTRWNGPSNPRSSSTPVSGSRRFFRTFLTPSRSALRALRS
jgi:hypothetical protein